MNLTNDQLIELENFAKMPQYSITDIAHILQIDVKEFALQIHLPGTAIANAYNKGKLIASAEFGNKITQLSNQGSGPAQTLLAKLKKETEINNLIEYYG